MYACFYIHMRIYICIKKSIHICVGIYIYIYIICIYIYVLHYACGFKLHLYCIILIIRCCVLFLIVRISKAACSQLQLLERPNPSRSARKWSAGSLQHKMGTPAANVG